MMLGEQAKSQIGTAPGFCVLFWTNPKSNTIQNKRDVATYHLSNKTSKIEETDLIRYCHLTKDKLISGSFLWTPIRGYTSVNWSAEYFIHQYCADTGCRLEDFSRAIVDREGWWESHNNTFSRNVFIITIKKNSLNKESLQCQKNKK